MALLGDASTKAGAGVCALVAIVVATGQIVSHLRNYTGPIFQRYIVRLIFMVPLYSILSFLSLMMPTKEVYIDSARDCYEAFVIYNFLSLCLAYVGGPGSVEVKMNGYTLQPSWKYTTCCLPPIPVNGQFVRLCKQGVLQFVFLKPTLAILQVVLFTQGGYIEGDWSPASGYLWITIIYNLTYTTALYALLLFYMGTHDLLAPFKPMLKFTVVKLVVFLTFWQGLFISFLVGGGAIDTVRDGKNLQNFLICLEMLFASFGMLIAFPYSEYKSAGPSHGVGLENMRHVISIRDVVNDTVHQFAPTYHDYVLYSNGGNKGPPKRVQTKTFVHVGHETANKKGEQGQTQDAMESNLLANMELGVHNPHERTTSEQQEQGRPPGKAKYVIDSALEGGDDDEDDYEATGRLQDDEEDEEGQPTTSASVLASPVHPPNAILRHAEGSGRHTGDQEDGASGTEPYVPRPRSAGAKQPWLKGSAQRKEGKKGSPPAMRPHRVSDPAKQP